MSDPQPGVDLSGIHRELDTLKALVESDAIYQRETVQGLARKLGFYETTLGGFEAEARQCFANIKLALERAGAGFKDVVRITAYVKDLADYPVYAKVRTEIFGADWPASASVGVSDLLLGAKLEVDAVAVINAS